MNWLLENSSDPEVFDLTEVGVHHEQQHQELMLTDLKHLFFQNPLFPKHSWNSPSLLAQALSPRWISFAAGVYEMGAGPENGFAFDNEKPLHRQFLESFDMAQSLVQNQSYLEFMQDDGYSRPELWLSEGWDWRQRNSISHPLYWVFQDENWFEYSLNWGLQPLHPNRPVLHLSFFEADAFARWSKARLPTEFEWELAARSGHLQQAHDVAWQWTQSSYSPYPGFQTNPGALGEYNGKFMINQYVLRGSSIATPCGHSRHTYRNFFPTHTRWQWTGIRLARSNL